MTVEGRILLCVSVPGEFGHGAIGVDEVRSGDDFIEVVAARWTRARRGVGRSALSASTLSPGTSGTAARVAPKGGSSLRRRAGRRTTREVGAEQEVIRAHGDRATGGKGVRGQPRTGSDRGGRRSGCDRRRRRWRPVYLAAVSSGPMSWSYTSFPMPGFGRQTLQRRRPRSVRSGGVVDGYLSDFGRTVVVGEASANQGALLDALHGGLDAAIDAQSGQGRRQRGRNGRG